MLALHMKAKAYSRARLHGAALTASFTALIAVGAYLSFPLPGSPVPVVAQNFFVVAAGMLLGPRLGVISVAGYLTLGALGFPVFAGGSGGIAHFAGPTGGYLVGFVLSAYVSGAVLRFGAGAGAPDHHAQDDGEAAGSRRFGPGRAAVAAALGFAAVYLCGVPVLVLVTGLEPLAAVAIGVLPFLPGDLIKTVAVVLLYRRVGKRVRRLVVPSEGRYGQA